MAVMLVKYVNTSGSFKCQDCLAGYYKPSLTSVCEPYGGSCAMVHLSQIKKKNYKIINVIYVMQVIN